MDALLTDVGSSTSNLSQLILLLAFALAGFLLGFGDHGRVERSKYLSVVSGLIWLVAVVAAFLMFGLGGGLLSLLASFVIAAITMRVGAWAVLRMQGPA
jgi:hypothetical protein